MSSGLALTPNGAAQDSETRMRFMGITGRTGELLREFWQLPSRRGRIFSTEFYRHVGGERQLQHKVVNALA
jgi:hypothetical protein